MVRHHQDPRDDRTPSNKDTIWADYNKGERVQSIRKAVSDQKKIGQLVKGNIHNIIIFILINICA